MGAVNVGVGHDDDFVIAELVDVELVADTGAEGDNHGVELIVAVDFIGAGLFDVEHFPPHGKNGLESGIAALNGGACGGIALNDIDFAQGRVALVAVL